MVNQIVQIKLSQKSQKFLYVVFFTLLLFIFFEVGFFGLSSYPQFGSDSFLLLNRLEQIDNNLNPLHPMIFVEGFYTADSKIYPYTSQFGLQGVVISFITQILQINPLYSAFIFAHIFCFILSFNLAIFFSEFTDKYGHLAVLIAVLLTGLSPWFYPFSFSLYWTTFSLFIPLVFAQVFYKKSLSSRKNKLIFFLILILLISLKSLCVYEFITTVIISALIPIFAYHIEENTFSGKIFRKIILTGLLCFLGFILAIALHILQIDKILLSDGFQAIMERAKDRSLARIGWDHQQFIEQFINSVSPQSWLYNFLKNNPYLSPLVYGVFSFFKYFTFPAITIPFTLTPKANPIGQYPGLSLPIGVCVILTLCGLVLVLIKRNHLDSNLKNLILITNASLLAPLSWQILAFNHMSIHFHLNGIIFYIPYLLYFFILLGFGIQSLWFVTKNKFPKLIKNLQKLFLIFILSFLIITTLLSWIHTRIYNQMSAIITSNPNQKYEQESIKGGIDVVDIIDNYYALDINRSTFNMKVKLVKIVGWAVDTEYASVPIHLLVVNNGNLVRGEIEFFHRDDINQAFKLNNQDNQAGFSFLAPISGIEDVKNLTQDIKIYAINSHNFSRFKKLN